MKTLPSKLPKAGEIWVRRGTDDQLIYIKSVDGDHVHWRWLNTMQGGCCEARQLYDFHFYF